MVYIVLFLLIFFPYMFKKKVNLVKSNINTGLTHEVKYNDNKAYFILASLFMILLLTLKHDYVGTDTQNYRLLYDMFSDMSFRSALEHINDVSFVFMFQLFSRLGLSFRVLLFLQGLFYISSVTIIVKRYSKMPFLSYWIFITFGYLIFATTMRQAIATALILLSYDFIRKQKVLHFVAIVLLATTFHISAVVFLPAYWIDKFRYNRKTLLLIISIIMAIVLFKGRISLFILSYSKMEYLSTSTGGYFLILYLCVLLLLGIIYRKNFLSDKNNKMLFYMLAAALALVPIARINPAVFRITYYYQIFTILYIPNLIRSIRDRLMRFLLTYGFIILGMYYFYYKIGSYGIRMHPYVFFWSEYPITIPGLN